MTNDSDIKSIRRGLIALRTKSVLASVKFRLSTLIEQLENYEKGTGDRQMLERLIAASVAEIAALTKGER